MRKSLFYTCRITLEYFRKICLTIWHFNLFDKVKLYDFNFSLHIFYSPFFPSCPLGPCRPFDPAVPLIKRFHVIKNLAQSENNSQKVKVWDFNENGEECRWKSFFPQLFYFPSTLLFPFLCYEFLNMNKSFCKPINFGGFLLPIRLWMNGKKFCRVESHFFFIFFSRNLFCSQANIKSLYGVT